MSKMEIFGPNVITIFGGVSNEFSVLSLGGIVMGVVASLFQLVYSGTSNIIYPVFLV